MREETLAGKGVLILEGLREEKEECRARMGAWLAEVRALRQKILERREGVPLPNSVEMLRELRGQRDEQILDLRRCRGSY